jgi:cytochrome b
MTDGPIDLVEVAVWDWPVRVVHWTIAALVGTLLVTGLTGGSAIMAWHMRAGEALLALVVFRILWGFAGSRNARFASFVRGPRAVLGHFRALARSPGPAHATHNPAGGWMVVALLLAMLVQCGLGLFTRNETTIEGPLVRLITEDLSDTLSKLHRRGWWLVGGLAAVHVVAVLVLRFARDENLINSMVSGRKFLPTAAANPGGAAASTARALVLLALCALAVWWTVTRL